MSRFFDLDSPLMRALSALMDWFVVSFFTLLCAVPVFTAGAAACGLYGAMGPGGGEPPSLKRFFRDFRRCFRLSCLCSLVLAAAGYFFYLYLQAVGSLPGQVRVLFWAGALFCLACLALAAVFVPPLIRQDPLRPFLSLWKTALILGIGCLPRSLAVLAAALVPLAVLVWSPVWFLALSPIFTFLWPALTGRLWVRLTGRVTGLM